jgi:hypothetical protein
MKSGVFTWISFGTGAVVLALGAPAVFGGCSSSSTPPPANTGGGDGASGPSCTTAAGEMPPPDCDDTDESCPAPSPACPTTPCNGSSACLAMADNTGKATQDFRFRKLNITAPAALAQKFVQQAVIDQGTFNWLVRFDPNSKQVTTGGAPPSTDPFGLGYCFVKDTIQGLPVQPVTVNMTQGSDGSWSSDAITKLFVPIFLAGGDAGTGVVVLPLSQAKVSGVTIAGGNCIGSYNPDGVTSPTAGGTCSDYDPSSCQRWHTAGALGGYITLNESEGVNVQTLGKTLCVLLTGGSSTTQGGTECATDANGNVTAQGDYCSTTNSPGGCADSYWLAATFAASAVTINDGSADPNCNGSGFTGGGGDGGTGGTDAAAE